MPFVSRISQSEISKDEISIPFHKNSRPSSTYKIETMHPVQRQAMVPAARALTASFAKVGALFGARELMAPIMIPTEAKFEKPQRA